MNNITEITIIKEFTNDGIIYGVYSAIINGVQEIFVRNGNSVGMITFFIGEPVTKCTSLIKKDAKEEFFRKLKEVRR